VTPPGGSEEPAEDEEPAAPVDARLVPAALAAWAVAIAALVLGWGVGAVLTTMAVLTAAGAGPCLARRAHRCERGPTVLAGVLAAGACAAAVGVGATAQAHSVTVHPLHVAAASGAAASVEMVVGDDPRPLPGGIAGAAPRVLVSGDVLSSTVAGRRWVGAGRLTVIAPARGWGALLPGQQVTAHGTLASALRPDLTVALLRTRGPPSAVSPVPGGQALAGELRRGLRDASRAVLAEEPAALLPGLVVGDTTALDPGLQEDFRTAGLTHLTAVSGTNVAIVVGAILLLARLARCGPRTAAVLAVLALVGFVVLARPSPSVLRAAVMGGVAVLALALGRRRSVLPALAASVIVVLLADPALAVDAGFALSVLATGALVLLAPPAAQRLRARGVPPGVAEALAVPVAAHVVTAPVIAGLSGQVSVVAVVANLLAAPAVAPATVLGVAAALLAPWWPGAAQAAVWLAGPEVSWLVAVARRCAAVPDATVAWPAGVGGALALAVLVVVALVVLRRRRIRLVALAVAVGVGIVLVPTRVAPVGWPPSGWAMVACDVGQGDALVLATGEPGRAVLVDAGPDAGVIDACLSRLGVRALALVVVSHLHADHVGGLAGALRGRGVGGVALGPVREPDPVFAQVRTRAALANVPVLAVDRGVTLRWPALVLEVLGPVRASPHVDERDGTAVNNTSVVLRAHTPAGRILLPGDAELAAQGTLMTSGADLHAEVLKVPHHGSRSSAPVFLTAPGARLAVISVGRGNTYGHPNPGVVALLARSGALVRRTDESGDVAVLAAPSGPVVVVRGDPRPDPRRR